MLKTPLRDGDVERPDDEAYADSYFVNANGSTAPGIVDADRQPIFDHSEVYSGVYGRASINFYAFNSNGNKGIACGLNNLQKICQHQLENVIFRRNVIFWRSTCGGYGALITRYLSA